MNCTITFSKMFLLAAAALPVAAFGQTQQKPAGSSICQVTPLDLTKMESNPGVLQAATAETAVQLTTNFGKIKENSGVDPKGEELGLINRLASAYFKVPFCQASQSTFDQQAAQSTTSQTNKQTGATSAADGTTSAVQSTGISQLLSVAEENGAVTSSTSGSTMTLGTSLYGLLTGFKMIEGDDENYMRYLGVRLGGSATFNVANSSTSTTTVTRKQVSQWQLKYSFHDLSARSPRISRLWTALVPAGEFAADSTPSKNEYPTAFAKYNELKTEFDRVVSDHATLIAPKIKAVNLLDSSTSGAAYSDIASQILGYLDQDGGFRDAANALFTDAEFAGWFKNVYTKGLNDYLGAVAKFETEVQNFTKGGDGGFNGDVTFGQQFPTTTTSTSTSSTSASYKGEASPFASGNNSTSAPHLPDYLVAGLDLSFQPTAKKNPNASANQAGATPDVTPIKPLVGIPSLTLNFNSSFYTQPNAALNESTFRGGKGAAQLQWSLGSDPFIKDPNDKSQVTFSLNGSYERLQENKDQKGKKPDIVLGSVKFAIPISNGVSFPLAVSFANAQEQQAKGSYVIGNFGISFDLDKLSSLLTARR